MILIGVFPLVKFPKLKLREDLLGRRNCHFQRVGMFSIKLRGDFRHRGILAQALKDGIIAPNRRELVCQWPVHFSSVRRFSSA